MGSEVSQVSVDGGGNNGLNLSFELSNKLWENCALDQWNENTSNSNNSTAT